MRVHQVVNAAAGEAIGGAERVALMLHEGVLRAGGESRLVALGAAPNVPRAVGLGAQNPYGADVFWRLKAHLTKTVRPGDVVHGHLFPTLFYVALLSRAGVLPTLVYTEHNTTNRRRTLLGGRVVDRALYGALDAVVAISEGVCRALLDWCPSVAGRTVVIPNGVPLAAGAARQGGPLRHIVSVGHLHPKKNYRRAIEAIAAGPQNLTYTILGEGPERGALQALIAAHGLSAQVRLAGAVSDPKPFLRAADAFFMPSLYEGFGLAAVEAMATGLPLITADVPGLSEVVPEGAGLRVDPLSTPSMAAALHELAALSPERRGAMAQIGRARAQNFGVEAMVAAHLRLYGRLQAAPL